MSAAKKNQIGKNVAQMAMPKTLVSTALTGPSTNTRSKRKVEGDKQFAKKKLRKL